MLKVFERFVTPPRPIETLPTKAVVSLGGGGARGLAHLGVMQAIAETDLEIQRVVGVSMGGFVGAVCCLEPNPQLAQARVLEFLNSPVFRLRQQALCGAAPPSDEEESGSTFSWYSRLMKMVSAHRRISRAVTSPSLIPETPLRDSIEYLLPDIDIADLPRPLSLVAIDLLSGQRIVLEKGPLRLAVQASAAIPGIFPPVRWENRLLCDVGVIESMPNLIAKSYASDLTVAVDVSQDMSRVQKCETALDVMMRVDDLCERMMRRHIASEADLVIRPEVGHVAWFDFTEPERIIEEGLIAARKSLQAFASDQAA